MRKFKIAFTRHVSLKYTARMLHRTFKSAFFGGAPRPCAYYFVQAMPLINLYILNCIENSTFSGITTLI